jgi:hypothetical protein
MNIPYDISGCEYLSNAYRKGWQQGHGIACFNVPSIGEKVFSESLGRILVTSENIREVHEDLCYQAANNSRSYSPFEFIANEFNNYSDGGWFIMSSGEEPIGPFETKEEAEREANGEEVAELPSADEMWEAFERGVSDSITNDLSSYTDEFYEIEEE